MKRIALFLLLGMTSFSSFSETVTRDHVRYREYPYLNMAILGKKNTGEEVRVMARSDFKEKVYEGEYYWYFIDAGGTYGWMYGEFLQGLKNPDEYRVYYFNTSLDRHIYDYDFENERLIDLRTAEPVDPSEMRTEYTAGNERACWFDTIEIRDGEGYSGSSDLFIKSRDGRKIRLPGDETLFYYDECSFMRLSPNGRYLMVDQGTSHIRELYIFSAETGENLFSGSYTGEIRYEGTRFVRYFKSAKTIFADKEEAVSFIRENAVRDLEGRGMENEEFARRIESAPEYSSFHFGNIYEFDTQTGRETKKEFILYYIDRQ